MFLGLFKDPEFTLEVTDSSSIPRAADRVGAGNHSNRAERHELQSQLRKMALVNQALFELVKDKTGITDEELRLKVLEVDLRDGAEDGKVRMPPSQCPECGGGVTVGALACQACGARVVPPYPFESA